MNKIKMSKAIKIENETLKMNENETSIKNENEGI